MAAKKKATKKTSKAKSSSSKKKIAVKKSTAKKVVLKKSKIETTQVKTPNTQSSNAEQNPQSFNMVVGALILIAVVMGYMRFKHVLMPATVNGSPIFSWEYVKILHQTSGTQVLDQLIVEKLIEQEASEQNVQITDEEMQGEIDRLEIQFESVGGLEAFLTTQGLSRKDIDSQVELNLKVQKIVAEKIEVTDEQVDEYYIANQDQYEEISAEEAKSEVKLLLTEQALQQEIGIWIQDLRSQAQITINLPGQSSQTQ